MESKKIYISMARGDKSPEEILRLQKNLTAAISDSMQENFELIEPYLSDCDDLTSLAENIKRMKDADYAVFFDDWQKARYCNIERFCAEEYEIQCIDVELSGEGGESDGE